MIKQLYWFTINSYKIFNTYFLAISFIYLLNSSVFLFILLHFSSDICLQMQTNKLDIQSSTWCQYAGNSDRKSNSFCFLLHSISFHDCCNEKDEGRSKCNKANRRKRNHLVSVESEDWHWKINGGSWKRAKNGDWTMRKA